MTNCLFGALGALAAAQGTMNNLNFGNATLPVLRDDLLGLAGRARGFDGTDARAHAHDQHAADRSGGARIPLSGACSRISTSARAPAATARWNAGDGIRRTIRFLEKMECTILSGHRRVPPFGLAGGEHGQVGENWVRRNDGRIEHAARAATPTVLDAGEAVIIQTPTAGGYGKASSK